LVEAELMVVRDTNAARLDEGQLMAGWIYLFIALGMVFIVLIGGSWMSWFVPVERGPFQKQYWRLPLWCALLFVIVNVVSLAGGFPGWLIFGSICVFVEIVLQVAYLLIRRLQSKKENRVHPAAGPGQQPGQPMQPMQSSGQQPQPPPPQQQQQQHPTPRGDSPPLAQRRGESHPEDPQQPGEVYGPPPRPQYSKYPARIGSVQKRVLVVSAACLILCLFLTMAVFFASPLRFYAVFARETGTPIDEVTPNAVVTKTNMLLYAFPGVAKMFGMNLFNEWLTDACGNRFNKLLTDDEKRVEILQNFISLYSIDMSIYKRPSYLQYSTVNDWFSRGIDPARRPISGAGNSSIIVSPADARIVLYEDATRDLSLWLKGQRFTAARLLDSDALAGPFEGGAIVVVRLAPQDYHRYHSPVTGKVVYQDRAKGPLHSVNADGMRSENDAIFNQREITIIESAHGRVAFVAIGAVCVGSIKMTKVTGDSVEKGGELGFFQFGGSTVVLMFERGAVTFARDLVASSNLGVEQLVVMGMGLGVFTTPAANITGSTLL
jgi:phosphatidylserine decarboxylase precursor